MIAVAILSITAAIECGTAYARDVLTDLEAELLKRLERAVDAARGIEPVAQRLSMEQEPDWLDYFRP